jgi:hypothetical protein
MTSSLKACLGAAGRACATAAMCVDVFRTTPAAGDLSDQNVCKHAPPTAGLCARGHGAKERLAKQLARRVRDIGLQRGFIYRLSHRVVSVAKFQAVWVYLHTPRALLLGPRPRPCAHSTPRPGIAVGSRHGGDAAAPMSCRLSIRLCSARHCLRLQLRKPRSGRM